MLFTTRQSKKWRLSISLKTCAGAPTRAVSDTSAFPATWIPALRRTIVIKADIAYVQAGAGIVADSVPEKEYQETVNKAKAMLKSIEAAHEGMI